MGPPSMPAPDAGIVVFAIGSIADQSLAAMTEAG
jgi:hypothetical protein